MTQLLRLLIRETLLQEEVYGAQTIIYTGTKSSPQDFVNLLVNNEIRPHWNVAYGKGLYGVLTLDKSRTAAGKYGENIIKLKVNLNDFIIFDSNIATKVYGKPLLPHEQAQKIGLSKKTIANLKDFVTDEIEKNAYKDGKFSEASLNFFIARNLQTECRGVVYTNTRDSPADGNCIVAYDTAGIIPVAWKKFDETSWTPIEKSSLKNIVHDSALGNWEKNKFSDLKLLNKLKQNFSNDEQKIVKGDLILNKMNISSLVDNLKIVNGGLSIYDNPISSLPKNLDLDKDLYIGKTNILILPDDLKVGGKIYEFEGDKTKVPSHLQNKIV